MVHFVRLTTLFIDNRNIKSGFFTESFFIVPNLYHIGLFYLNAFLLYPLLFNKRRWWLFILAIAAVIAVSYYLKLFYYNSMVSPSNAG